MCVFNLLHGQEKILFLVFLSVVHTKFSSFLLIFSFNIFGPSFIQLYVNDVLKPDLVSVVTAHARSGTFQKSEQPHTVTQASTHCYALYTILVVKKMHPHNLSGKHSKPSVFLTTEVFVNFSWYCLVSIANPNGELFLSQKHPFLQF